VPASGWATAESSGRTQSLDGPVRSSATNASRRPWGDSANRPTGNPGILTPWGRTIDVRYVRASIAARLKKPARPNANAAPSASNFTGNALVKKRASALAQAGSTGVTLQFQGTSPTSARILYYSNLGALPVSWTIAFYAATPNLGAVITEVTVRGISVTTQVISRLSSLAGNSITSMPTGFSVDRVYSCNAPGGDDMMVIEGHRPG